MLNQECRLPTLANESMHKSTTFRFHSLTERGISMLEKKQEKLVGSPSVVIARKSRIDETVLRMSTNLSQFFVGNGIDAIQLYS